MNKAVLLGLVCLAVGVAGGWFLRDMQKPESPATATVQPALQPGGGTSSSQPTPAEMKQAADVQAAPLLAQLKSDPKNVDVLTNLGNLYYDAKQYGSAVDYYGQALAVKPTAASVRTDMGTAYWFQGDADRALAEFTHALKDAPNFPNALYNRGLVRWQGKGDAAGALADWNQLLATAPQYDGRAQVESMVAEVKQHQAGVAGKAK
jgi:tetratricopeptide (TPR) repeat protein